MNSKLTMVLRIILGLALVVFGANKFFGFIPNMEMPAAAGNLMSAMMESGYMLKLVGVTEIIVGLLLLIKKWVPFALIVLAPISLNMIFFHIFLAPAGMAPAVIVAIINILLIYDNWGKLKILF
ncbi:DoxX family membrane protein [Lutibacter sp.]|uniref:DoxX family membrane protein n=1 Tax=Lutibacter sp. TaxID=1925666 RepID=UPI0025BBAFF4|nr:DoxX family membrane protein [Lutibacter sp.]MCF6168379.1 DoxX family membrane protein [Lutibacter sp.]